jgi:anti-sigma factor RsiW
MNEHTEWLRQLDPELDGELNLVERAALARHLASCPHCAGARASHLELRVAMAHSAGAPQALSVPRPVIRGRTVMLWTIAALVAGLGVGWTLHARWGIPGGFAAGEVVGLEATRARIVVR